MRIRRLYQVAAVALVALSANVTRAGFAESSSSKPHPAQAAADSQVADGTGSAPPSSGLLGDFLIREKVTRADESGKASRSDEHHGRRLVHDLRSGELVNAFSILQVVLAHGATRALSGRKENLSRTVDRSSSYVPRHPELLTAGPLPPIYVNDAVLEVNPFLLRGDAVVWLAFNDVSSDSVYREFLQEGESYDRSLMTVNLQEMRIRSTGASPESYRAHDGDRLRIRVPGAAYDPRRAKDVSVFQGMGRLRQRTLDRLSRVAVGIEQKPGLRDDVLVGKCLEELKNLNKKWADTAATQCRLLTEKKDALFRRLLNDRQDSYTIRFADRVTHEDPVIALGRPQGHAGSADGFNPIKTTPSIGSN